MLESVKRITSVSVLSLAWWGCASMPIAPSPSDFSSSPYKVFIDVNRVRVGMTRSEVSALLGDRQMIGYAKKESAPDAYESVFLKQPFRAEALRKKGRQYEVLYYYLAITEPDDLVSDEELMPIVFEQGQVVGKGRDFLFQLQSRP